MGRKYPLLLVVIIFSFYYFLTISIPPFWEDHSFHQRFIQTPFLEHIKHTFKIGNEDIFSLERPVLGAYFHLTFRLFKYDFFWHQLTKILFTAFSSLLLFSLIKKHVREYAAFGITLFSYLSYPFFSNFLQYDNPFVFSEFFKVAALFFLLRDISKQKTRLLNQFFILFFTVLAFRTYNQALSVVGVIILFVLIYKPFFIKRYCALFLSLIIYNFPLNITSILLGEKIYANATSGLVFFEFFYKTATSLYTPFILPQNLYYMPLIEVFSFFGTTLSIIILSLLTLKKVTHKKSLFFLTQKKETTKQNPVRMLTILSFVWIICEMPLWYFAPDPTVRYLSGIMIPSFILLFVAIRYLYLSINKNLKKPFIIVTSLLLIGLLLTNVAYAYLFRITWGSAFIAYAKVNDYLEETRTSNAYILYHVGTAAKMLFPLDKQSNNYAFKKDVIYNKGPIEDFSEANIKKLKKKHKDVYVLKSRSAFGRSEYPSVPLESYKNIKKIKEIKGTADDVVDKITALITKKLNMPYESYTFTVYTAT